MIAIQAEELLKMSQEVMDAKHLKLLLREADADGDGEISLDEYLEVMGITDDGQESIPPSSRKGSVAPGF